jgi:hypothetical protein
MPTLSPYPFERAREAFTQAYARLGELAGSLTDEQLLLPSRCRGWAVCDVLCHLHLGLVEVLIGFAGPTGREADADFASYWAPFPGGADLDLDHVRFTRLVATAYTRPSGVVEHMRPTLDAVLAQAGAATAETRLASQEQVLGMGDFLAVWAVEAALHHLDVTVGLPEAPLPPPGALAVAGDTLDALLGQPVPMAWDDVTYALKGAGRVALTDTEAAALGDLAGRFPLLG